MNLNQDGLMGRVFKRETEQMIS